MTSAVDVYCMWLSIQGETLEQRRLEYLHMDATRGLLHSDNSFVTNDFATAFYPSSPFVFTLGQGHLSRVFFSLSLSRLRVQLCVGFTLAACPG